MDQIAFLEGVQTTEWGSALEEEGWGTGADLREVAAGLPLDRLLVETDAPFLAPEGHRGKRNEPAFVVRVGETLAALHDRSVGEIADITSRNAREFYGLPEPEDA